MRHIQEVPEGADPRLYFHPEWRTTYPWIVQGITGAAEDFDLRLFGGAPVGEILERWERLGTTLGFDRVVHARQVHGNRVTSAVTPAAPGLELLADCDGHATNQVGILLTVAVADCVPVYLVDPATRLVAVVHAGWRGVVAGVLDSGVRALTGLGADVGRLRVHLGPHICARCYEVGPEVHAALGFEVPERPTPVSLVDALAARATRLGIPTGHLTASSLCTRCDETLFYSHRGGGSGRQVGVIGVRPS